ncbi:hypothetical protein [Streptomyces sp. NPDC005799]|uniref:hypothetical protein n=1 Tax=Streptomyces sp. NPDC005799 TaxID=3154678 RepID=UPI0034085544
MIAWTSPSCRSASVHTFSGSLAMASSSMVWMAQPVTHQTRLRLVIRDVRWSRRAWLKAAPSILTSSFDHRGNGSCRSSIATHSRVLAAHAPSG